ncbi:MAG: cation transporter [Myxococcota bacterium]
MMLTTPVEYPKSFLAAERRAKRIAAWSIIYVVSTIVFMGLTMGGSQAMKTVWFDDILGLIPPVSFLVGAAVAKRRATADYPYGFLRAPMIGHLASALALIAFGIMLAVEAVLALLEHTPPSIGGTVVFGRVIWSGWLMLAALAYSIVPMAIFGHSKEKAALPIHDRALLADAAMARADWLSGGAAVAGVVGVGLGFWWADAVAALVVSLDILHDGAQQIRGAVSRLIGAPPRTLQKGREDVLIEDVKRHLLELDWVAGADVRLREEGHVVFGEATVVPRVTDDIGTKLSDARQAIRQRHWRMHDLTITVAARLPP